MQSLIHGFRSPNSETVVAMTSSVDKVSVPALALRTLVDVIYRNLALLLIWRTIDFCLCCTVVTIDNDTRACTFSVIP